MQHVFSKGIKISSEIIIEGRKTEFIGPSPAESGIAETRSRIVPYISDRQFY